MTLNVQRLHLGNELLGTVFFQLKIYFIFDLSLRISARGNGTCQLSDKPLDPSKMMQSDTIFDPDFDLYARKTSNCLVDPKPSRGPQVPRPGGNNSAHMTKHRN